MAFNTDSYSLTKQFQKIDPTVSGVSRAGPNYQVKYKDGTTRTIDPTGLQNLQSKYLIQTGTDYREEGTVPIYAEFYAAVTPEDIAKASKGYVAPKTSNAGPVSDTTLVSHRQDFRNIDPFTPDVSSFNYRGGAPYAGLAAIPAPRPVSLVQMPTAAPVLTPSVQTIGPGGPVTGMKKGGLASVAQDLASKGRYGDTMVAHISPQEAGILKALGGSGTINPETGLPEFFLDKIFKAVLPAAAGYFLGPAGAGLFSSGLTAGLTVGGLTAIGTGSFEKGLSAGLGAYGGFGLSKGVAAAGGEKELFKSLTGSTPAPTAVGSGAGGVSAGSVPIGATTTDPSLLLEQAMPVSEGFAGTGSVGLQAAGPQIGPSYGSLTTPGAVGADYSAAATGLGGGTTASALSPVDAFTDTVGLGTAGSLYAGTVALPSAIEEQEKIQREQAALLAKDEEEKRKYRELFASTLGAVPTRTGRSGGLMKLAGGGMTYMEAGGTTGPTGAPRDVTGTGDGMSDSVPATIEGVQEARLADGEFVVPADVVADIGNGSSDAGSKKLYDMMDRIRKARHGTTEQPPEIDAEALMPA